MWSSNPTTDTSRGTARPRWRNARSSPIVIRLLAAKAADGRSTPANKRIAAW